MAFCALPLSPGARMSMTTTAPPVTSTTKPYAPSVTAASASCTAASATTPPTTNTPHGHTAPRSQHLTTYEPGMSDMEPLLSSGQGEAAATTVVGAAASVTE